MSPVARTQRPAFRPSIPPVNGQLSQVVRQEFMSDGGGGGSVVDTQIWAGTANIYVTDQVEVGFNTAGAAIWNEADTTVVVPSSVPGTFTLETGDRLTYTRASGTVPHTRRIVAIGDRNDFGFVRTFCREE